MGLDIYFTLVSHPRKQKKGESVSEYFYSIDAKQDKEFSKNLRELLVEQLDAIVNMGDEHAQFNARQLYYTLKDDYFGYDFEIEPLKNVSKVDDVKEWYNGLHWEWITKPHAGYFRKVNAIYRYFSERLEDEVCEVTKDDLADLISRAKEVLLKRDEKTSVELLPTQDGFFFGPTQYDDDYYRYQVVEIINVCSKMLADWVNNDDKLFVRMSW